MTKLVLKLQSTLKKLQKNNRGEGLLAFLGLIVIIVVILGVIYLIAPGTFTSIINKVFDKINSWFGG